MSLPRVPNRPVSVVLLHGQPGTSEVWTQVLARLPSDVLVTAPDRPGYGRNPAPATGLGDNAERLVGELRSHGRTPALVVAHSWAGGIALALAERHPEAVGGLALLGSLGPGAVLVFDRVLAAPFLGPALVASAFYLAAPLARRRLRRLVGDESEVEQILAANRRGRAWRSFVVEQRAMLLELPGLVARLSDIRAPTVVVAGERDRLVPPATARALAAAIPGADLRTLVGVGHDLPLEAPDAVAAAVVDLIARVEAAR